MRDILIGANRTYQTEWDNVAAMPIIEQPSHPPTHAHTHTHTHTQEERGQKSSYSGVDAVAANCSATMATRSISCNHSSVTIDLVRLGAPSQT